MLLPAKAQACEPPWVKHHLLSENLKQQFQESRAATGVVSEFYILELLVSEDSKTWTVVLTGADGCSTPYMSGHNWEATPIVIGEPS